MVMAFLFIQLIGDMTNECGNKRSVRLRREMDVLSAGRIGRSTVSAGKWPESFWAPHITPEITRRGKEYLSSSGPNEPDRYISTPLPHGASPKRTSMTRGVKMSL